MASRAATLREHFTTHLPSGARQRSAQLGPVLEELYARGEAAWPRLRVPPSQFAAQLAFRFPPGKEPAAVLPKVHAEDLYLACACALGDGAAVVELAERFVGRCRATVARVDSSQTFVDDALAALLQRLTVAERAGAAPRIAEYAGRGPLLYFVRTAASFVAVDLARAQGRGHEPLDEAALGEAVGPSAELQALRAEHGPAYQEAFDAAVKALHPRDRTLLRMHFLEGVGIDALGTLYRVHRSTAARWVQLARDALWVATRSELTARLRLRPSQLESLIQSLQSNLIGALRVSVLRAAPAPAKPG